jgi:hypothetical protein
VHMKTAHKKQPAIHLRHMEEKFGGLTVPKKGCERTQHRVPNNQLADMDGPNVRRRQPRPRYARAEDKLIAETRQHMEEQLTILGDQIKALTTQFSNMGGHNRDGSRDPSAERGMHGRQHHVQAHANQWENGFKLNIPEFERDLQPEEFLDWVLAVEEVFEFNGVPDERRVSLVVHTFRRRVATWWQQLKQSRVLQGQLKINSWEKLLKKMRVAFLPRKYTMGRQSQNWRQWSMAVKKKKENSYKKRVFRETWSEAKSPRQANWAPTCQLQIHKPNPYSVEEEIESADREFQESEFIGEEFEHECIKEEDPSQGFVDWDSLPTYDDDVNEKDPIKEPLAFNLEEEYEVDGFFPMFSGLYTNEDDQLEDKEPTDDFTNYEEDDQREEEEPMGDITDYEEGDDGLSGEVPNYNEEEVEYIDFLGVEDILNSLNNDLGEFYAYEENYMFTREIMADPFLSIFMARGREKEQEKYGKVEYLPSDVRAFNDKHRGVPMMKSITFIVICCLVLILRKGEWNELTGHPKDCGKNQPNPRTNSLKPGEDDVD